MRRAKLVTVLKDHRYFLAAALVGVVLLSGGLVWAYVNSLDPLVGQLHAAKAEHLEQGALLAMSDADRFQEAFEHGDEFFATEFNAVDGGGANVGNGERYTHVPRADLDGTDANGNLRWASHTPSRATGPNAAACTSCHEQLFEDGAGAAVGNVHRDPLHSGDIKKFIQRNTPHNFALGATQRLAEEMTAELQAERDACSGGVTNLTTKGISFGYITTTGTPGHCTVDASHVQGVATDLIVRPFQWKGSVTFIRDFTRGAMHNEIGMQPVETTGYGVDGDGDGVVNEVTVGDITAVTVYMAAQPRPTTKLELASLNIIDPLSDDEVAAIKRGANVFNSVGCATCHVPKLIVNDPIFREPSASPQYRDVMFPAGFDPVTAGVDYRNPVKFDLTRDQPQNQIKDHAGRVIYRLGSFARVGTGAEINLYGDLKRHEMGAGLAEAIDEEGTGKSNFLTRNLWGVGSTAPYMHDGRATTLTEAILAHGGEALTSANNFRSASTADQKALIAFLDNLILFKMDENQQVVIKPPKSVHMNDGLEMRKSR